MTQTRTRTRSGPWASLLVVATLLPTGAIAQVPNEALRCVEGDGPMAQSRYLRALSLDLRGDVPTADEYRLAGEQGVDATLDAWLWSEGFLERMARLHRDLLWNNISNLGLLNASSALTRDATGVHYVRNRATMLRGAVVPCLDEPAVIRADGTLTTRDVDGRQREGFVEVAPYWAPDTTIKVCAFDAQTTLVSASDVACDTNRASQDSGCGCGPELRWCQVGNQTRATTESFAEAIDHLIRALFEEGAAYTDLFSTRRAFVNGPIVHFWKHQRKIARYTMDPAPLDPERLPDLQFSDRDTWVEIEVGPEHAGLLTRAAFLLRFQTNRARANRFYTAFLCQPFEAPAGGLPDADDDCSSEPDLQQRCGCNYCHALLEPAAAYWGRWAENGSGYLDPDQFPAVRADCEACARTGQQCNDECRRFYLTRAFSDAESEYLGTLQAYAFRRPEHGRNVERGPELLAFTGIADNRLPMCVASRAAEWLLGRPFAEDERKWQTALARDFVTSGYDYRALVRAIVTSPTYRRVR
jgi:hypothetical protein